MPQQVHDEEARRSDAGVALPLVIGLGLVMILLITTGVSVALSGLQQANTEQSTTSAMDAAFAGVQDYLAHVNADPSYAGTVATSWVAAGNPNSVFSRSTGSKVAMPTGTASNPAFGVSASGTDATWGTVPGSGSFARFRYEVDDSTYRTNGVIRLQVTGMAGTRTKTILANIRVRGFVDYSYFTDYEIQDPQISGAPQSCVLHAWEGRPADCGGVHDSQFGATDAVSGDVHSNDTLRICGSTFTGNVTTANPNQPIYTTPQGCASKAINIKNAPALSMPATNSAMKTGAGCLYTGPTKVVYNGDGTMTVSSPWTKYTKVTGSTGSNNVAMCGDPNGGLATAAGATVPELNNDLLFVQNVQSVATDPNYWDPTVKPANVTCLGADGLASTAATGAGWSLSTPGSSTVLRYPLTNETPASGWVSSSNAAQWNATTPAYGCRNGDLYVSGKVTTLTTAASENYVYIVGDITYLDNSADVLGLVGQNAVLVWNPINASGASILTDTQRNLSAAIVSVAHTFQVQNFYQGSDRGSLNLFGSIAQKFRGPVGAINPNTGYSKSYAYDPKLKTVSPPKFLAPSSTSFQVTRYASVPIAFDSTGTPR